jgi:dihydroorotate dehydrogenase (NAD+) catalytic subunit
MGRFLMRVISFGIKDMNNSLAVAIGKLKLKNPVMVASGTFGYADEFRDFIDLRKLGAIVTKTVTLRPREGNAPPRTCETPAGMLNSIGLENPGAKVFIEKKLPFLRSLGIPIIMSIAAESSTSEFLELARMLNGVPGISALELNISCPNVRHSSKTSLIAQDAKATFLAVKTVRSATDKVIITKLSPNVTDITEIALAAEQAGSDAVALINTLTGMCIDIETRRPKIAAGFGGLSGPALRPIAVRMVWEVYNKIKIPIIGMGGIMDAVTALEFIIAGSTAISVGTANFINPAVTTEIIDGMKAFARRKRFSSIRKIKGSLQL